MKTVGIRDLRNALSRYVRRAEAGERILVTDHGRVIAALAPATGEGPEPWPGYRRMLAAGIVTPPTEHRPTFRGIKTLKLPRGTARRLIDEDRCEG